MRSRIVLAMAIAIVMLVGIGFAVQEERQPPGTAPRAKTRCATSFDCPEGVAKIGDRVIFVTDDDGDGFFEKNVAIVTDNILATAAANGTELEVGNLVNLWVFPSALSSKTQPYTVRSAKRGRSLGQYEALANSNH